MERRLSDGSPMPASPAVHLKADPASEREKADTPGKPTKAGVKRTKKETSRQPRKAAKLAEGSSAPEGGAGASKAAKTTKRKTKADKINEQEKAAKKAESDGNRLAIAESGSGDGLVNKSKKKKGAVTVDSEAGMKTLDERVDNVASLEDVVVGTTMMEVARTEFPTKVSQSSPPSQQPDVEAKRLESKLGIDEMRDKSTQVFVDARVGIDVAQQVNTPESGASSADAVGSPENEIENDSELVDQLPAAIVPAGTDEKANGPGFTIETDQSVSAPAVIQSSPSAPAKQSPPPPEATASSTVAVPDPAPRPRGKTSRRPSTAVQEKYCPCGKQKPDDFYIACDTCEGERWFHNGCVGLSAADAEAFEKWVCEDCVRKGHKPVLKRRCGRVGCGNYLGADRGETVKSDNGEVKKSKYCSEECGMMIADEKLGDLLDSGKIRKKKGEEDAPPMESKGAEVKRADEIDQRRLEIVRERKKRRKEIIRALEERRGRVEGVVKSLLEGNETKGEKEKICGFDGRIVSEWVVVVDRWGIEVGEERALAGEQGEAQRQEGGMETGNGDREEAAGAGALNGDTEGPDGAHTVESMQIDGGDATAVPPTVGGNDMDLDVPATKVEHVGEKQDGTTSADMPVENAVQPAPSGEDPMVGAANDQMAVGVVYTEPGPISTEATSPTSTKSPLHSAVCGTIGRCTLHEGWEFIKIKEVQVEIDEQLHLLQHDRHETREIKLRLRRRRAVVQAGLVGAA
ncbi:hypothetical protein HDV00_003537 [Rhizophlyctis rosea]|nr:hypothetical protein HDV00_003537 [Rhizophlyctis rosea]